MQHCSESVKAYEKLPAGERNAFLEHFVQFEAKDTLKALLITCVRMHSWQLLSEALKVSAIRDVLWVVIDDLITLAHSDGSEDVLCQALPETLSEKEGRLALVFPSRMASWTLAEKLIAKGARPGRETFTRAFSGYQSRVKSPFEFNLLTTFMAKPDFNWVEILSFSAGSSAHDILKRSKTSSKPAYIACAFALMNDEQKALYVAEVYSKDDLPVLYPHITNEGKWMQHLPSVIKGKILSDDIGI